MTTSIAILKILSSYPEGHASVASLKADMAMLVSPEWSARMRTLGTRVGTVRLFSQNLATRDATGWTITETGREFLERLETGDELPLARPSAHSVLRVVASKPASETVNVDVKRARLKVVA